MKRTLEFGDTPEDNYSYREAVVSVDLHLALQDIATYVRQQLKHGNVSKETAEVLENVKAFIPYPVMDWISEVG